MRNKKVFKSKKAFTLLELSVVILIIGILIAGTFVGTRLISKSRLAAAESLTRSAPISGIRNNMLWLETSLSGSIDDSQANDGSAVTSWYDQSSSSNKLLVVAVGNGATYANTINYVHAIKFAGSTANYLQISDASFLNNTDYTIMVLEKRQSSASDNYFIGELSGSPNTGLALGYSSDSTVVHTQGNQSYTTNATVSPYASSTGNPRQFTFVHSSTAGNSTYINGVLAAQDATKTSHLTGITSLAIGKGYNGEIGEIAIFTRAVLKEERQSVEDYLGKKWSRKNNRDSISNASACLGYTITDTGCDLSASPCSINVAGLVASVSPTANSTSISCNQTNYSGSVNYTCVNGVASVSGSCTLSFPCSDTPTGVSAAITANHGATGTATCNVAGYAGTASYTCNNGTPTYTSSCSCDTANGYNSSGGNCVAGCLVPAGSGVSTTWVAQGASSLNCDSAGYIDNLVYTCASGNSFTTNTACTRICTGGNVIDSTSVSGYVIHKFTTVGTSSFNCPTAKTVRVLVVAGGGAGGAGASSAGSGGGGGGGVVANSSVSVSASTNVSVTVGAGGAGAAVQTGGNWSNPGNNGGNSVFGSLTAAVGGGGGGGRERAGTGGGSGGGGGVSGAGAFAGGSATSGQGYLVVLTVLVVAVVLVVLEETELLQKVVMVALELPTILLEFQLITAVVVVVRTTRQVLLTVLVVMVAVVLLLPVMVLMELAVVVAVP